MSVTHDTSFTMRGATDLILQHHQMLVMPRKMTRIIYPRDIWNVICNARRNRHHPPTSPHTAPATNTAPATPKCTPKSKRNSPRTVEASIPMSGRFDHDPSMIRPWTRHLPRRPFAEVTSRASETHFVSKITTFRASAIYPNLNKYCACHAKVHSKI